MYLFVAGFLLLNLFVGVICDSMMQMQRENEEKALEDKAWLVATRLAHLKEATEEASAQSPAAHSGTLGGQMFEEEDSASKRHGATKFVSPFSESTE